MPPVDAAAAAVVLIVLFAALYLIGFVIVWWQDYRRYKTTKGGGVHAPTNNRSWAEFWRGKLSSPNSAVDNRSQQWKAPDKPVVPVPRIIGGRNKNGTNIHQNDPGEEATAVPTKGFTTR